MLGTLVSIIPLLAGLLILVWFGNRINGIYFELKKIRQQLEKSNQKQN